MSRRRKKPQASHTERLQAESTGEVLIRRKDVRTFALVPERKVSSPLDVPSIKAKITTQEIVDIVREGRERWEMRVCRAWHGTREVINSDLDMPKFRLVPLFPVLAYLSEVHYIGIWSESGIDLRILNTPWRNSFQPLPGKSNGFRTDKRVKMSKTFE